MRMSISHQVLLTSPRVAGRTEGSTEREFGARSVHLTPSVAHCPLGECGGGSRTEPLVLSTLYHQRETWEIPLGLSEPQFPGLHNRVKDGALGRREGPGRVCEEPRTPGRHLTPPVALVRHFTAFEAWTHHYHRLWL